jgi:xanthine dehydrogenase accessory factor
MVRRALVRGSGDVGSAMAYRLYGSGYAVAIHDDVQPTASRRGMAFLDAIFDGCAWLDGQEARRADDLGSLAAILADRASIPISVGEFAETLAAVAPDVLIDARMRSVREGAID